MRQLFCGRHIGRDLMIPLYILSAQTRKLKNNNTHNILYTYYIPLPFLQARELKKKYIFVALFVFNYVCLFSFHFFFQGPMYCTGFIDYHSSMSPPVWKSFDKFTLWKWRAHVIQDYIQRTLFTVHEEVVKKTTSARWEKEEQMQSLHLLSMLNLWIQQPNYIHT